MTTIERRIARGIICGLAIASLTVAAHAADLGEVLKAPAIKDPLPDKLTWNGITLYGVVDVGYGYNSIGAPLGGSWLGLNNIVWASPAGYRPISSLNTNAYDLSVIGLKFEEPLGNGWQAVGQFDTGFNPLTGTIDDACKDIIKNNGVSPTNQTVFGPSSRCGQMFNGQAWAGVRNTEYGALTVGRQSPLALSKMYGYDPVQLSGAFSLLGFGLGGWAGGTGSTEAGKWNNSVKYAHEYGPIHGAVMYAQGSNGGGLHGNSYAANLGATWKAFSVDAIYTANRDAVLSSGYGVGGCGVPGTPSCSTLASTAFNTDAWSLMGKYVYDLGDKGFGGKLIFYAGYQHIKFADPSNPVPVGSTTNGDYVLGSVNNTFFLYGSRNRDTIWVGTRYETGPWTFTGAYYLGEQGFFRRAPTQTFCADTSRSNCSGSLTVVSATADYAFTKHLDVYAGVVWSKLTGGLARGYTTETAGYPTTPEETSVLTGVRFRF